MGALARAWALCRGQKMVRFDVRPQSGGYMFLTSPNLRGFSLMLRPDDFNTFESLSHAVEGPLVDFIRAEIRAVNGVRITQLSRDSNEKIVAGYQLA